MSKIQLSKPRQRFQNRAILHKDPYSQLLVNMENPSRYLHRPSQSNQEEGRSVPGGTDTLPRPGSPLRPITTTSCTGPLGGRIPTVAPDPQNAVHRRGTQREGPACGESQ